MKSFEVGFWLLIVLAAATVSCAEGQFRARRDLRYRPNVAYAYQYRTDQIAGVQKVPIVPVPSQLLHPVRPRPVPVQALHFPTRRPMQAVDRLHTRVEIGSLRRSASVGPVVPVVPVVAVVPGTVVTHSRTEFYPKHR